MLRQRVLRRLKSGALLLLLGSLPAAAVEVRFVPAKADSPFDQIQVAIRGDGEPRNMRVRAGEPLIVNSDTSVSIEVNDPAWWSPVITTSQNAEVPVWPAAQLAGQFQSEKVDSVEVAFELKGERHITKCNVSANAKWQCRLPETRMDLRLSAPGFAPHYLWDVELSRQHTTTLPPLVLRRGGSITGWVAAPVPAGALVRLQPMNFGNSRHDAQLLVQTRKPTARGFFQFTEIPEGTWVVVAEAPKLSRSKYEIVEVGESDESLLRDSLALRPLANLELQIRPAMFSPKTPWSVSLARRGLLLRNTEELTEHVAGADGNLDVPGIVAGEYLISVKARGSTYKYIDLYVEEGIAPVQIDIDTIVARGRVAIGDEGISAQLKFSSPAGNARTKSKESGEFLVVMPQHDGPWHAELAFSSGQTLVIKDVEVVRREDDGEAWIDLQLPRGRIRGRAVDESGRPVKAGIIAGRGNGLLADILAKDGTFDLIGIDPGPATIFANNEGKSSEIMTVHADENLAPIELVVRKRWKIEGWLTTPSQNPIGGALVRYFTPGAPYVDEAETSPSGRFVLQLEPNTAFVDVAIAAPGKPSKLLVIRAPRDGQRVDIVIGSVSGRLIVPPRDNNPPYIEHHGAWSSVRWLLAPFLGMGRPNWLTDRGIAIDLEPGDYTVCAKKNEDCVRETVIAGTTRVVEARKQ